MGWACGAYGWGEGVCRVLVGKPEVRRSVGRPRRRWVDNIRTDLQEVGCGYMDWIGLVQDRETWRTLVSAVMNLRVPWNAGNFLTSCKPISFSRRTLYHGVSMSVSPCRFEYTLNKGFVSQRLEKTTANSKLLFLLCYRLSCLCCYKAHINWTSLCPSYFVLESTEQTYVNILYEKRE